MRATGFGARSGDNNGDAAAATITQHRSLNDLTPTPPRGRLAHVPNIVIDQVSLLVSILFSDLSRRHRARASCVTGVCLSVCERLRGVSVFCS